MFSFSALGDGGGIGVTTDGRLASGGGTGGRLASLLVPLVGLSSSVGSGSTVPGLSSSIGAGLTVPGLSSSVSMGLTVDVPSTAVKGFTDSAT